MTTDFLKHYFPAVVCYTFTFLVFVSKISKTGLPCLFAVGAFYNTSAFLEQYTCSYFPKLLLAGLRISTSNPQTGPPSGLWSWTTHSRERVRMI